MSAITEPASFSGPSNDAVDLVDLRAGDRARLAATELDAASRDTLVALGLGPACRFRIARAGSPWILQVRATRIGLTDVVARALRVIPE